MNSPTLAIAISLYDRWDELMGLLELLRLNWQSGRWLSIIVTSTAEEAAVPRWVDRALADQWQFGSSWKLPPRPVAKSRLSKWFQQKAYGEFKQALRARTVDCIQRGGRRAAESGKEYTLHVHAAAWPLKEEKIYDILRAMRRHQAVVGGRGYGRKYIDAKHPAGDIDDNFFFIDNAFARRSTFWEFDPARDADRVNNEGRVTRRVYELCNDEHVYIYENFANPAEYVVPTGASHRQVQPYNYHERLGLLRSHDMTWQARLVREFGFRGPTLDRLSEKVSR